MVFTKWQGQKEERTLDGAQGDLGCPCVLGRSGVGNSQLNLSFCVAVGGGGDRDGDGDADGDGDGDRTTQRGMCKGKLGP